jgi:hypothetical protein
MPSYWTVERIDVFGDCVSSHRPVLVDFLFDDFFPQATEERFGDRVIPAVASTTHAGRKTICSAEA